jgi:hypothetical protein
MADVLLQPIYGSVEPNSVIDATIEADGFPAVCARGRKIPADCVHSRRSPNGAR